MSDLDPRPPATARSETLSAGMLDLRVLTDLVGPSPEDVGALLDQFQNSAAKLRERIGAALAAGDGSELARHAHTLAGAASYAGAAELSRGAAALEAAAKRGVAVPDLAPDAARLDTMLTRLPEDIARALAELSAASG
jgi:HPt (histidine-containing phosphotransfer) domain-containing protein